MYILGVHFGQRLWRPHRGLKLAHGRRFSLNRTEAKLVWKLLSVAHEPRIFDKLL
jgi:hypothetical protein